MFSSNVFYGKNIPVASVSTLHFDLFTSHEGAESSVLPDSMKLTERRGSKRPVAIGGHNLTSRPDARRRPTQHGSDRGITSARRGRIKAPALNEEMGQRKSIRFKELGQGLGSTNGF